MKRCILQCSSSNVRSILKVFSVWHFASSCNLQWSKYCILLLLVRIVQICAVTYFVTSFKRAASGRKDRSGIFVLARYVPCSTCKTCATPWPGHPLAVRSEGPGRASLRVHTACNRTITSFQCARTVSPGQDRVVCVLLYQPMLVSPVSLVLRK